MINNIITLQSLKYLIFLMEMYGNCAWKSVSQLKGK